MDLLSNITQIKGVGEKTASLFKKLNIETVKDLVFYIPRDFDLFDSPVMPEINLKNQVIAFSGYMQPGSFYSVKKGHLDLCHVSFLSDGQIVKLTIFNMPYLKKQLDSSTEYIIRGMLEVSKNGVFSMTQPKIYTQKQYAEIANTLQPLYPLTKGLSNNAISKAVKQIINEIVIPEDGLEAYESNHMLFSDALKNMHFPTDLDSFVKARARIVFHEFLSFILQMKTSENSTRNIPFDNPMIETAVTKRLLERLPYRLTNAQLKVWKQIVQDMTSNICMNRLVQGDVGSGKTIIAILTLLLNADNGHQGVMMAPTEVLAKQHFENIIALNDKYKLGLKPVLLLGSMGAKQRKDTYSDIATGECNVIVGTHAVFQKQVEYNDLTLVITDEQHRFGVKQREALVNKGKQVHILVMSATPIPRSLAMIMYGDISLSVIDEMPSNRIPIKNCVVNTDFRKKAYEFIVGEVNKGHQAYVICPQVEEGLDDNLENVVDYAAKLQDILPKNIIISYLHGKMSLDKKNEIMEEFKDKKIDVLVSTTVIEVGIDVPNATVIMVENSERFGLAQLHQLRGRVGRGADQSYCIFISTKDDDKTMERLKILNNSNDGFHIADEDLRLRGPGDLFGIRQSGEFGFSIGDIYNDASILREAGECANILLLPQNQSKLDEIMAHIHETTFDLVDFRTI